MGEIKLSKKLSYLLRHRNEPLKMDNEGWVNINDILTYFNITIDELDNIVESDDKDRFSYNEDKTKIRANQGHSLPFVKIKFKKLKPPKYLYHGTNPDVVDSILKNGIEKRTRNYVHLSNDVETAYTVGVRHTKNKKPTILTIDSEKMYNDGYEFFISKNMVWLVEFVPKKYIIK